MPFLIPRSGFDQEISETEGFLSQFGDVRTDLYRGTRVRISFVVAAPGYELPTEAVFEFHEWYRRSDEGWLRERYSYEYRPAESRKAHHLGHPGLRRAHQHCEPRGRRSRLHYDDHERLLRPTAEELGALHASGKPIECGGLRRLYGAGPS